MPRKIPTQVIDAAYKSLESEGIEPTTIRVKRETLRLMALREADLKRIQRVDGQRVWKNKRGPAQGVVRDLLTSDLVEFLGYEEFYVMLRNTRERQVAVWVYNRIRDKVLRGI